MQLLGHLVGFKAILGRDQYGPIYGALQYASARVEQGGKRTIDATGREFFPAYTLVTMEPLPPESLVQILSGPYGKDPREYVVKAVKAAMSLDGYNLYEVTL